MADLAIRITASDQASDVLHGLTGALGGLAGAVTAPAKGLLSLGQGIGMLGVAAGGLSTLASGIASVAAGMVSGNAEFERYETQFGVLLKSTDKAKERLAMLADFGAKTPFELPELVRADKVLTAFGLHSETTAKKFGVSGEQILQTIGDVASGTGANFEELSVTFGKFASGATGEAIARFQELGIATRQEMASWGMQFSKSGELLTPVDKAFGILEANVRKKFGGMMDAQSNTFEGMGSNLQDWLGATKRQLMAPVFDVFKDKLGGLLGVLNSPAAKAAVDVVGAKLAGGVQAAVGAVEWLTDKVGALIGYLDPNNRRDLMREWFGDAGPVIDGVVRGVKEVVAAIGGLASTGNVGGFVGRLFGADAQAVFQSIVNWLSAAIPSAVSAAASVWTGTLQPALAAVGAFITDKVIPAFGQVVAWLSQKVPAAVSAVVGAFNSTLLPALQDVTDWIGTNMPVAAQTASTVFTDTLTPAFQGVAAVLRDYLIPLGDAVIGVLGALGNLIIITLEPAARAVWGVLQSLATTISDALMPAVSSASAPGGPLYAIGQAFQWILDRVRDLTGWLRGLEESINRLSGKSVNVNVGGSGGVPGFAEGGIVPGPIGAPQLAVVHGGETVTPPGQSAGIDYTQMAAAFRAGIAGMAVTVNVGGQTMTGTIRSLGLA